MSLRVKREDSIFTKLLGITVLHYISLVISHGMILRTKALLYPKREHETTQKRTDHHHLPKPKPTSSTLP